MATKRYLGNQVRRTEIHYTTVTAVAAGGIASLTINSKTVQYIATATDTTATVAAGLVSALRSAVDPEFQLINASVDSTTNTQINVSAAIVGNFITATGAAALSWSGSGGVTLAADTLAQAGKSPSDVNDAVNWSGAALPANSGDDWWFEYSLWPALFNWSSLSGKSASSVRILPTFSGSGVGLQTINPAGFEEFRGGRAALTAITLLSIQIPDGAGFEAFRFNSGDEPCEVQVFGTNGNQAQLGEEVVDWIGNDTANTVEVVDGSIRIAPYVADTAVLASVKLTNSTATIGKGTTVTTVSSIGSQVSMQAAATITTLTADAGSQIAMSGTAAITTITTFNGSQIAHSGTGTITTLLLGLGCVIDFSGSRDPITVTNKVIMEAGSALLDPNGRVTLSGGYQTSGCTAADVTVNFGPDRSFTVA